MNYTIFNQIITIETRFSVLSNFQLYNLREPTAWRFQKLGRRHFRDITQ